MENDNFSDEDQFQCMYTWKFFAYIFSGNRKTLTRKISTNKTPPWWIPSWKIPIQIFPTWNIPTHVFKYSHPSSLFFSLSPLSLILLKDCFVILCFKSGEVFAFVKTCQNKVKKGNQWNGWGYLRREFSGWGIFHGGIWWVGISGEGIPQRGWEFS